MMDMIDKKKEKNPRTLCKVAFENPSCPRDISHADKHEPGGKKEVEPAVVDIVRRAIVVRIRNKPIERAPTPAFTEEFLSWRTCRHISFRYDCN